MNRIDRWIARAAARYAALRIPSPTVVLLAEARMQAARVVRARHRDEGLALAARADAGDRGAAVRFGELAERALAEMRDEVNERARRLGGPERWAAAAHARFGDTDESEYLDDPTLDPAMRVRLLARLDALNDVLGVYRAFLHTLEPLVQGRATRVLDLASGHGGFALALARMARERGLDLEVTATDLRPEYLALGEEAAEREGLPVRFAVQDALDLSNLERGAYDVIVCTQSLHHFAPSMVARLFREAARAAGRGVVLLDGCRSVTNGLLVPALGMLRFGDKAFAHDAWVSLRRFYAPEELGVLVGLGPEGDVVESQWEHPGHCLVRFERARFERARVGTARFERTREP